MKMQKKTAQNIGHLIGYAIGFGILLVIRYYFGFEVSALYAFSALTDEVMKLQR